jgi:hypothetical protein
MSPRPNPSDPGLTDLSVFFRTYLHESWDAEFDSPEEAVLQAIQDDADFMRRVSDEVEIALTEELFPGFFDYVKEWSLPRATEHELASLLKFICTSVGR